MGELRMFPGFLLLGFGLLLAGCQSLQPAGSGPEGPADEAFSELLMMIEDRLELHHEGARLRWDGETPEIYRESVEPLIVLFEARGLPEERAKSFFAAQMQASEIVQRSAFEQWSEQGLDDFDEVIGFEQILRPELQRYMNGMEARLAAIETGDLNLDFARNRLEEARESMRASENIPDDAVKAALSTFRYSLRVWRTSAD